MGFCVFLAAVSCVVSQTGSGQPLPYVVLGGKFDKLKDAGIEKVQDVTRLRALAADHSFEFVEQSGFYYLLHRSITNPVNLSDIQFVLNVARDRNLPAVLKTSDGPDVKKAVQNLLAKTRLGVKDNQGRPYDTQDAAVQVSVYLQTDFMYKGSTWKLTASLGDAAKSTTWPKPSLQAELQNTDDEEGEQFNMECNVSKVIPPGFGKDLVATGIQIANDLESKKLLPIRQMESTLIEETLKPFGPTNWLRATNVSADLMPEGIKSELIKALQSNREMDGRQREAEAMLRAGAFKSFKASIFFTTGVQKDGGASKRSLSLNALLK